MTTIAPYRLALKEILVASDLSDASSNAISYAKAIARRYGSHILLVHVSQPPNPTMTPEGAWIEDDSVERAEAQMEAAGVALRAEGFSADAVNSIGSVGEEVQRLADVHHADLIILGTHSRRGLDRLLFGSEAEGLIRSSDRPVLTVGPSVSPAAQEAWAPKDILCATSLDPRGARVAAYGYSLAQATGATFAMVSVENRDHSPEEDAWRTFEEAFAEALPEGDIRKCQIRSFHSGGSPAPNITDVARTLKSDLIVMGAKAGHLGATHLHPGVLAKVLVDAPCPVLTISND